MHSIDSGIQVFLEEVANHIISSKEILANHRFNDDRNTYTEEINNMIKSWRKDLIEIYGYSIIQGQVETFSILKEWGKETVDLLINLNLSLDDAIEEVRFYRDTIGGIIKNKAKKEAISIDVFYETISKFDSVVDKAIHWLSLSYSSQYSNRIILAETTAFELSIPVVRITSHIGIIPIIGVLDTQRASHLMEKALQAGSEYNLNYIIIDLSGVPIIDTMVAHQIFKVIDALRLIGIETRLSGIRIEIAQTMVSLGINFSAKTFSSLHLAIKDIL
jgi:rsbT co-antagonist protein RsbR